MSEQAGATAPPEPGRAAGRRGLQDPRPRPPRPPSARLPARWLRARWLGAPAWLLLAVGTVYVAQNLVAATHPWHPDALSEGLNLDYTSRALHALRHLGSEPRRALTALSYQGFPYGPPLYVSAALSELLLGEGPAARLLPNQLAMLLALGSTAALAARFAGPRAGWWAAGWLAALPMVTYYARHQTTEAFLLAAVPCTLLAAVRSGGFERRGATVLFGAVLGLAALVKASALQLLFFPLLAYFVFTVGLGRRFPGDAAPSPSLRGRLAAAAPNLLLAAVLAVALGWHYYRFFFTVGAAEIARHKLGPTDTWGVLPRHHFPRLGHEGWWHWFFFYPRMFLGYQAGAALGALAAVGAALGWRQPGARWALLGVAATTLLYTFMVNKKWYYLLPLLPLLAVSVGPGLARLAERSGKGAWALGAALLLAGAAPAWVEAPTLLWNRPALLQVAPPTSLEDPSLDERLAAAILERGARLAVVLGDPVKTGAASARNPVFALSHRFEHAVARAALPLQATAVEDPCALAALPPTEELLLYVGRGPQGWLEPDAAFFTGDCGQEARARAEQLRPRMHTVLRSQRAGWTVHLAELR